MRQDDRHEFEAKRGYTVRPNLKMKQTMGKNGKQDPHLYYKAILKDENYSGKAIYFIQGSDYLGQALKLPQNIKENPIQISWNLF